MVAMYTVLVLAGGSSNEREVSLRSGEAVRQALQANGYEVSVYDPKDGKETLDGLLGSVDVVFPALHGQGGEDGTIQAYLEAKGKPFVGPDSQASELCFDKWRYKQHVINRQFLCPKGALVHKDNIWKNELSKGPFVLKPVSGGSSIDTFIVREPSATDNLAIEKALNNYDEMLLEELILGIETTVAILGNQALPMVEIVPPADQEFDYENKYNGKTQELCPPQNIGQNLQHTAQNIALEIHRSTGCKGMSRTDIIITPEGQLYVLETNTIPGLTDQSLLPKAAQAAGINMPELVKILIEDALNQAS